MTWQAHHEKLCCRYGELHYLSIILVKDSYLFKIIKLIFNFYLKLHNFK